MKEVRQINKAVSRYNSIIKKNLVSFHVDENNWHVYKYTDGQIFRCKWDCDFSLPGVKKLPDIPDTKKRNTLFF